VTQFRLAELVAGLSVVSDLGKGLADGQGLRGCVLACQLAQRAGLQPEEREAVFWVGLLRFVGCTATAAEMAAALGDELAVSAAFAAADPRDLRDLVQGVLAAVGHRPDRVLSFLARAPGVVREHEVASCEVARTVAGRLALPAPVATALGQVFERWDGHGHPGRAAGEQLSAAVRVWQVAHTADLLAERDDGPRVADGLRRRAGRSLDPELARLAADDVDELLAVRAAASGTEAVLAAEPQPWRIVEEADVDAVLAVFGLVADLKAPCFRGHSERVATLAAAAARTAGRPAAEVTALHRAGLVHDVGRVAVSSRIWARSGPLSDAERESVRLHPYYTARALARVPALAALADLACAHHERCDGSGYHRGLSGPALSPAAGLLAAADAYVTSGEERPHRPARPDSERVAMLREAAATNRLPATAVEAVLAAAGAGPGPRLPRAGVLTDREHDVLDLVADGLTNAAIGRRLGVSAKTVNAHLEHVYAKLDVSTRASAVVAAIQRGELQA
jgi:HD-GYP domain-containing protein (c-di-GMP phosphodiesterase class II)/DNA-binding CsgD family transcriptional regulator